MTNETKYQVGVAIATFFALVMLPSNVEQLSKVYWAKNEIKTNTGVLETAKDWKENLPKTIQTLWAIEIQNQKTLEKNTWKASIAKKQESYFQSGTRIPEQINSKTLVDAWINNNLAKEIVNVCNNLAKEPNHCIRYASAVSWAESGWWKKCYNNNCFWIKAWTIWFKTLNDWVIDWVTRYNKYWWKATSMSQFYSPKWKLPYFRYCTSEYSSDSKVWCPNWLKHANFIFNKLK